MVKKIKKKEKLRWQFFFGLLHVKFFHPMRVHTHTYMYIPYIQLQYMTKIIIRNIYLLLLLYHNSKPPTFIIVRCLSVTPS